MGLRFNGLSQKLRELGGRAVRRAMSLNPFGSDAAILMFHRIAHDIFDPWGLAVTPEHFRSQMEWLRRNRPVLPLDEFALLHSVGSLPAKATAITFDDGYACAAKVAAPVLKDLRLPATIFLPIDLVDRGREFWWDELERIVLCSPRTSLMVAERQVALGAPSEDDRNWPWNSEPRTARQYAFQSIWAQLRLLPPDSLDRAMQHLREQAGFLPERRESHRPMYASEARSIASGLLQFGSHAMTHPSLPRLTREQKQVEIAESSDRIRTLIGVKPSTFAYPYGDHDRESQSLVKASGFACACVTEHRCVHRRDTPFALPRLHVRDWDARQLSQALRTA